MMRTDIWSQTHRHTGVGGLKVNSWKTHIHSEMDAWNVHIVAAEFYHAHLIDMNFVGHTENLIYYLN